MVATLTQAQAANSATAAAAPEHLVIEPQEFRAKFNNTPFVIGHRLTEHPLFDLERLLRLARELPEKDIEYNAGTLPINQDPNQTPRNGLSVEETVQRIRECKSWMVIKHVENDPEYGRLLDECLAQVREYSEEISPGMRQPHGYIFLTSPGSVTPYHMDPEHNFLLQIKGSKIVHQFDGNDRGIVSQEELEQFYGGRVRNMKLADENRDKSWVFNLEPGQGLHFPVTYPHFVQNGGDVSVSFSITWRTPDLDRRLGLHTVNWELRRRGWRPAALGRSPFREGLKYQAFRVARKLGWKLGKE